MTTVAEGIGILVRRARALHARRGAARLPLDRLEPPHRPAPRLRLAPLPARSNDAALLWPTTGRLSSRFGERFHPIRNVYRLHAGVDIAAPIGTPVWAADRGTVVFADLRGGYGQTIVLDHGDGRETLYAHLSAIHVRVGEQVAGGQLIGAVGRTGEVTGAHLHFETRRHGRPVDPGIG